MTTITKLLAILCGILALACVVLVLQNASKERVIEQQARSIQYGLDRARYGLVIQELIQAEIEASRKESAERLCIIEQLKAELHAPPPVRPKPRSKRELRESIRKALSTR